MVPRVVGEVAMPQPGGPARAPGMKYRHYAPNAPVVWVQSSDTALVHSALRNLEREYGTLGVAAPDMVLAAAGPLFQSLGPDAVTAANRLFQAIRALDQEKPDAIVVVWKSREGLGLAISNRLEKAASGVIGP
jgi:L-threonylcarbamoyladenylate synthase